MSSLPLGAVRMTQEFLAHDPPKRKELARVQEFISEEVGRVERRIAAARPQVMIATSGTAAALASLAAARRKRNKHAPAMVSRRVVQQLAAELPRYSLEQRIALPGIGPRRAEIIIAGALVFAELLGGAVPGFRYSSLGLRDGVLAQMAADYGHGTQLQKRIQLERWHALRLAGKHYAVNSGFAECVRNLSVTLFKQLRKVHALPAEYEEWLSAAAMLHEVGAFINRAGRRRHTYYIIAHSEIFGYTTQQRRIIAAIARYVGNSRPAASDQVMKVLRPADRDQVKKAAMLLRLARALEQSRRGVITEVTARIRDGSVVLKLKSKRGGAALEMWALEKERAYFRDVFGRTLTALLS
jgi:exopolyphosphatase/guanosine-5'-triphosphate,3'-diphosphate pyrophosphatase